MFEFYDSKLQLFEIVKEINEEQSSVYFFQFDIRHKA